MNNHLNFLKHIKNIHKINNKPKDKFLCRNPTIEKFISGQNNPFSYNTMYSFLQYAAESITLLYINKKCTLI